MITYALDTNIVSYFLKGNPTIVAKIRLENSKGNQFIIPPMVYFEIQNWLLKNKSTSKMLVFKKMYSSGGVGAIDKTVLDIASTIKLKLQQQGKGISDDDLFIAAYCIRHDLPLVTNNTRHFIHIENIKIINWAE
jgi:tRNA(fMet)-specific endonuclease VapC